MSLQGCMNFDKIICQKVLKLKAEILQSDSALLFEAGALDTINYLLSQLANTFTLSDFLKLKKEIENKGWLAKETPYTPSVIELINQLAFDFAVRTPSFSDESDANINNSPISSPVLVRLKLKDHKVNKGHEPFEAYTGQELASRSESKSSVTRF